MKMAERDNLIQTQKDIITALSNQYAITRKKEIRIDLDKAYDYLDELRKIAITPEVGMGATGGFGSDYYPYTIVWVSKDGKKLEVTSDNHHPVEGFDYYLNQEYIYTSNMNGVRTRYRLRKNGRWVRDGEPMRGGTSISIGYRRYYQNPSF